MLHTISTSVTQHSALSLVAILAWGFFLGMRHATDADHVVAISTVVTRERSVTRAAIVGALWGTGHTLTILGVGAAIILFSLVVSPRLGLTMELSVGLMLIVLGAFNLLAFRSGLKTPVTQQRVESPANLHSANADDSFQGPTHTHAAAESNHHQPLGVLDRLCGNLSVYQVCRPLLVGIVHGLAGSAAVALLVLTTIQNSRWAAAYLLIFGFGTIAGMMMITVALGSAIAYADRRSEWFGHWLGVASGWISLAFGLLIAYQIGIVDGLFTGQPHWTPH
jgi:high-affinity nickel permease